MSKNNFFFSSLHVQQYSAVRALHIQQYNAVRALHAHEYNAVRALHALYMLYCAILNVIAYLYSTRSYNLQYSRIAVVQILHLNACKYQFMATNWVCISVDAIAGHLADCCAISFLRYVSLHVIVLQLQEFDCMLENTAILWSPA